MSLPATHVSEVPILAPRQELMPAWPATESVILTKRESDVLRLLATGMTDRQIAATLCVSRKTVSNHVASILRKIGAATRAGAASYAVRAGLA